MPGGPLADQIELESAGVYGTGALPRPLPGALGRDRGRVFVAGLWWTIPELIEALERVHELMLRVAGELQLRVHG